MFLQCFLQKLGEIAISSSSSILRSPSNNGYAADSIAGSGSNQHPDTFALQTPCFQGGCQSCCQVGILRGGDLDEMMYQGMPNWYIQMLSSSKLYTLSYRNGVYIILLLPKNVDILKIWSWMKLISILIFAPLQAPRMKRAKSKISDPSKISSHPNPSAPLSISFGWHDKTPRKPSVQCFVDATDLEIPHSYTAQCIKRIKHVFCTKVMHKLSPILWHDLNAQSSSQNVALCHPTGARKAKTV